MRYKDLLSEYKTELKYIHKLSLKKDANIEELNMFKNGVRAMYQAIVPYTDFSPCIRKPSHEEIDLYYHEEDNLIGVIDYRDNVIPIYLYGMRQQMYARFKGHILEVVHPTSSAELEICMWADNFID